MNTSESIAALAAALCAFQGQVHGAAKTAVNPHLKNKYADLASVWEAIREPLAANGLAVVQLPAASDDNKLHLRTRLLHKSGEWIESVIVMPLPKQDPQGYGSALTYSRRYALTAMLGIIQEDDDGNAASKTTTSKSEPTPQQRVERANGGAPAPSSGGALTEKQLKRLFAIAKTHGLSSDDLRDLMAVNNMGLDAQGMAHTNLLNKTQYDRLCDVLIPAHGATAGDLGEWPGDVPA